MELRAERRRSAYTNGVKRSSAWGWPDRHSVSSCVKLAGTCIVVLSARQRSLIHGTGVSPKHTGCRRHEGISARVLLLPLVACRGRLPESTSLSTRESRKSL